MARGGSGLSAQVVKLVDSWGNWGTEPVGWALGKHGHRLWTGLSRAVSAR